MAKAKKKAKPIDVALASTASARGTLADIALGRTHGLTMNLMLTGVKEELEAALKAVGDMLREQSTIWMFNWTTGGYNTVHATTREEALKLAREKAGGSVKLVLDESSLRQVTREDVDKVEDEYRGMFD